MLSVDCDIEIKINLRYKDYIDDSTLRIVLQGQYQCLVDNVVCS